MTIDGRELERRANAGEQRALRILEPRRRRGEERPPEWIKPGAHADYHAVIGGDITKPHLLIRDEPFQSESGTWVVFVRGVSGYVACEALTWPASEPRLDAEARS